MSGAAGPAATHGDFTWHELMTDDPASAQAFYARIFGWRFEPGEVAGRSYSVIHAGDIAIGGILGLDAGMRAGGARPVWAGYVAVEALAAAGEDVRRRGGTILMEGLMIPGMGDFALAADPEQLPIYLMEYETAPRAPQWPPAPGTCAWNELAVRDPGAALAFHGGLFGWRQEGELPIGEHGAYRFIYNGARMIGAVMPVGDTGTPVGWTFYFVVPDIDAAATQVRENGGTLLHEPQEIPGGDYSLSASDPAGALFGMVGPRIAKGGER